MINGISLRLRVCTHDVDIAQRTASFGYTQYYFFAN